MQRHVFLKWGGRVLFLFNIFMVYQLEILEITFQSHHQLQDAANINQHQQPTSSASCSWWRVGYMLKRTSGQVLMLPCWCLVHPAPDNDFAKLLYSLQNCLMHLKKKKIFSATIILQKNVILSCIKMSLKISHTVN